jgi:iron(III) transport system ATP-binding protein
MADVSMTGVTRRVGGTPVLDELDLLVADGELVALLGAGGCGKSTTLRCVAGLDGVDEGHISIGTDVVTDPDQHRFLPPERRGLGMVFHNYALWPHMTVAGNVGYPLKLANAPRGRCEAWVREALAITGIGHLARRSVTGLTRGEQLRVALARAVVGGPKALLLDDPLSTLDREERAELRGEIRRIQRHTGVAALFATRDQSDAAAISDRILVMREGFIEQSGTPREISRTPATRYVAEYLGYVNFLPGLVIARRDKVVTVRLDVDGSQLWCASRRAVSVGDRVELTIRGKYLRLRDSTDVATNAVSAVVRRMAFAGDMVEYDVRFGDIDLYASADEDAGTVDPGTVVQVYLPPERLVILSDIEQDGATPEDEDAMSAAVG